MKEWLKDVSSFADRDHTGSSCVVHTIMEVIDTTCIHDLLAADVWAYKLCHPKPELSHGSVVLGTTKQPHVRIRQVVWHRQSFPIWTHKRTCISSELDLGPVGKLLLGYLLALRNFLCRSFAVSTLLLPT